MTWVAPLFANESSAKKLAVLGEQPESALFKSTHDAQGIERWLVDSPLLQLGDLKVRLLATRLTQLKHTPRQKALSCFAYVRGLPFGCVTDSTSTTASEVMKNAKGDSHTKGTLLVALLRASGVPSRLRFVTLKSDFLYGIMDLKGQPVEHAIAEVWVQGKWVAIDSYVADNKLSLAARVRLSREGRTLGYGIHLRGNVTWDGMSDSFAQFALSDKDSLPLHDWGAFDDPHQFYSSVRYARNRLSWANRAKWAVGATLVNRRVNALRHSLDNLR